MSLHNTDIQGNANISRNANVGGHANVNGDVVVGHNLFVKGWIDATNIKGTCKGLFASEETLKAAYPKPMPGWFALVGDTLPADIWRAEPQMGSDCGLLPLTQYKWTPTGEQGGQFTLWLDQMEGDVKDLTDDVRDLEELLDNGLLLGETIAFTSTGTAAAITFTVMMRDGSVKPYSKPIPIVTAEEAGMMSAADKKELSAATAAIASINGKITTLETNTTKLREDLNKEIADREAADTVLSGRITDEATARKKADDALQALIDKLRLDFDTMYGADTSEKIDNFTEIIAFLDGVEDTETLMGKITSLVEADLALGKRIDAEAQAREEADDELREQTANVVTCTGFLDLTEEPSTPGTYIRKDGEGDPVLIVTSYGTDLTTEYPEQGKVYICQGKGYIYNGIMLVPVGHRRMIFDGGTPATRTNFHLHLNGGTPATRASILKQIDCGTPQKR